MEGLRYLFFDSRAPASHYEKKSQPFLGLSINSIFNPQILVRGQNIISALHSLFSNLNCYKTPNRNSGGLRQRRTKGMVLASHMCEQGRLVPELVEKAWSN
jgi:hypothetical protein